MNGLERSQDKQIIYYMWEYRPMVLKEAKWS